MRSRFGENAERLQQHGEKKRCKWWRLKTIAGTAAGKGIGPTFSSTSGSRLPMNRLAPMSWLRLSCDALFTRIGLPYTLIMLRIFTACCRRRGTRSAVSAAVSSMPIATQQRTWALCRFQSDSCERFAAHIVGIIFCAELHEAIALVLVGHPILRQVDIDCGVETLCQIGIASRVSFSVRLVRPGIVCQDA